MTLAEACCCLLGNRKKRKKKRSRAAQCRLSNTWVFGVVRTLSDRSICAHGVINNVSKRQKPFSLSVMADDARLILSFRICLQYPPVKASEPFEITSSLHFTFVIHTWFQLNNRADNSTGFDVDLVLASRCTMQTEIHGRRYGLMLEWVHLMGFPIFCWAAVKQLEEPLPFGRLGRSENTQPRLESCKFAASQDYFFMLATWLHFCG